MQAGIIGEPAVLIPERRGRGLGKTGKGEGRQGRCAGRWGDWGGARRTGGPRVHSRDSAVWTPPGGFAQTSPRREAGSRAPGFRRGLSRWIRMRGAINTRGTRTPGPWVGPGRIASVCREEDQSQVGCNPEGLGVRVQRAVCVQEPRGAGVSPAPLRCLRVHHWRRRGVTDASL